MNLHAPFEDRVSRVPIGRSGSIRACPLASNGSRLAVTSHALTRGNPGDLNAPRAFVLLAVLVFIFLLSMIALTLLFQSRGDETAGQALMGGEQAWSAAMSGVEEAMRVAAAATPGSTDWEDDPTLFRAREVYQDGADTWYFTLFSPAGSDSLADVHYGLSDEASRINLNHPGDADLSKIPGLTPTLASILRQFIGQTAKPAATSQDTNALNEAMPGGQVPPPAATSPEAGEGPTNKPAAVPADTHAPDEGAPAEQMPSLLVAASPDEADSVSTNTVPAHGPLATLDELLLAPGFTRALLHGGPAIDAAQPLSSTNANSSEFSFDDSKPKRPSGLDQYFTVFSRDPNRSLTGQSRCNLNDTNAALPAADLPADFTNYLAAARAAKVHFTHCSAALEASIRGKDKRGVEFQVSSGITKENLPVLLELFAADAQEGHEGLVNVNTASAAVLATLPGIDLPLAEAIVSTRTGMSPERRTTTAWLYQEGLVDAAKFKAIAPNLTARSTQFRFTVVGYGLPSSRYRVMECVIDVGGTIPRLLYLRDITRLGIPINLKEETPDEMNLTGPQPLTRSHDGSLHSHG